ncbi:TetR/AcrR family transcriptional regulator [uncultured Bradyrhizobium sp.]|uniref:TetR/AcrR family transcriptional regulator n=1 Tax=uncultured Bradyrhizobium sp. TaxID=199684 RepID=UPI0035CC2370
MAEQLSAQDWVDQGIRVLIKHGFTALKADPLAKAMGVSRGSFYWHFKDIGAFHAAILARWREIAAERIIAAIEADAPAGSPMPALVRRAFGGRPALESAVRAWAAVDPAARDAVQAIDRRRLTYMTGQLEHWGLPHEIALARAQIMYWAFLGFALSDKALQRARQDVVITELIRMALR